MPKHQNLSILGLFFLVLLTRLPFLASSYGTDPDSYRVVLVARKLAAGAPYQASRLPGYPVHEFLTALTIRQGPFAANASTAVLSGVAAIFFALILRHYRVRFAWFISLVFALVPIVYTESTKTIDYIWALAFMLGATYFCLRSQSIAAGILIGLATGSRITAAAMLLPLGLHLVILSHPSQRIRRLFSFLSAALLTAGVCYLPVILTYGERFFTFSDHGYPQLNLVIQRFTVEVWGTLGLLSLLLLLFALVFNASKARQTLSQRETRAGVLLASLIFLIYIAIFFRLPHETGYLVPIVPFVLLLAGLLLPGRWLAFCLLPMLLASFITAGPQGVSLNGPIQRENQSRLAQRQYILDIVEKLAASPDKSVLVAGVLQPFIHAENAFGDPAGQRVIYLMAEPTIYQKYKNDGYQIYYLPGVDGYQQALYGWDIKSLGAQPFEFLDQ